MPTAPIRNAATMVVAIAAEVVQRAKPALTRVSARPPVVAEIVATLVLRVPA